MFRFRAKPTSERSPEWRCCFCLHVRTATIMLGIWHLVLHLAALTILAAIIREPRLINRINQELELSPDWSEPPALPTPLSNIDHVEQPPDALTQQSITRDHSLIYHDVDMGALVTVCTLAITLMLIYGAARGKPGHILPFFCLQLFDFAITILTATGYLCYLRSIHRLVAESPRMPWRDALLSLPAPALALVLLAGLISAVMLKGYCISVVWRCYKYLTMRAHASQTLAPFVISDVMETAPAHPAPDYSTLLPNYDEAVKQMPPPSYQAAVQMHNDTPATPTANQTVDAPAPAPPAVLPHDNTQPARV